MTPAAKRGPRTSTRRGAAVIAGRPSDGGQGASGRSGTVLRRSDRGSCRRGTGQLCGARSAGCPRRESSRSRPYSGMGIDESGQFLRPGRAAAAADQPPVAARRRTASGSGGRRARAPRRGGSRRPRGRTARPGRVVCSCCSRAFVAGTDRRTRWRTGRRSGRRPAGRTPSRSKTGTCAGTWPVASAAGVRTAPLRVAQPPGRASGHHQRAASATIPIALIARTNPTDPVDYSRNCRFSR